MTYSTPLDSPEPPAPKSLLPKLELICISVAVLGMLFKIMHWPFSGMLLVFSLGVLATIYFLQTAMILKRNPPPDMRSRVGGMACSIATIGILFKIQHWPDANFMLILGAALLFILIFTGYIMGKHSEFLRRQIILMIFSLLLFWKYNTYFPPRNLPEQTHGTQVSDSLIIR